MMNAMKTMIGIMLIDAMRFLLASSFVPPILVLVGTVLIFRPIHIVYRIKHLKLNVVIS
ncbi:hypothetical protein YC2023_054733 [Brassica napus]